MDKIVTELKILDSKDTTINKAYEIILKKLDLDDKLFIRFSRSVNKDLRGYGFSPLIIFESISKYEREDEDKYKDYISNLIKSIVNSNILLKGKVKYRYKFYRDSEKYLIKMDGDI